MRKFHTEPDLLWLRLNCLDTIFHIFLILQVGDADIDHAYLGLDKCPTGTVHRGNPGSDLAADFASWRASAFILLKNDDPDFFLTMLINYCTLPKIVGIVF